MSEDLMADITRGRGDDNHIESPTSFALEAQRRALRRADHTDG